MAIIMKATNGSILQTFSRLGGSDEVRYKPGGMIVEKNSLQ